MSDKSAKKSIKDSKKATGSSAAKPILLSGGNPKIAKADGDASVQAYIEAMPGWNRMLGAASMLLS